MLLRKTDPQPVNEMVVVLVVVMPQVQVNCFLHLLLVLAGVMLCLPVKAADAHPLHLVGQRGCKGLLVELIGFGVLLLDLKGSEVLGGLAGLKELAEIVACQKRPEFLGRAAR